MEVTLTVTTLIAILLICMLGFIWLVAQGALRPCEPAPSSSIRSPLKGELEMNTYTPMLKHTPKQIP